LTDTFSFQEHLPGNVPGIYGIKCDPSIPIDTFQITLNKTTQTIPITEIFRITP
jgi:hypothetical protein